MKQTDHQDETPAEQQPILISDSEFNELSKLIYDRFGIYLPPQKKSLLASRLHKKVRHSNFNMSFEKYYNYVISDKTGTALVELVDLITTNMTFFNREKPHFDFFIEKALPEIIKTLSLDKKNDIRLWSAGCSTGEEPYTLVILMLEYFGKNYKNWNAGVLATDISHRAIATAKKGVYTEDDVNQLPQLLVQKYFQKILGGTYALKQNVVDEVTFRHFNLINQHFPFKKPFHVIFCRNVMIYFDAKTRLELVNKLCGALEQGGYLILGHSESIPKGSSHFKYIMPSVYQKL